MKVKSESEVAQSFLTLSDPMVCKPTRLLRPWDFPGKSTGVGCHCLLRQKAKEPLIRRKEQTEGRREHVEGSYKGLFGCSGGAETGHREGIPKGRPGQLEGSEGY